MENNKLQNIELKSEQLNEVLSKPPRRIIRYGNTVFFLVILLLIFLSWLIEYPDEILGTVTISSSKPPIELRNQQYFKLEALNVYDKQVVKKNTLLAQFNNQADPVSIEIVKAYLQEIENTVSEKNLKIKTLEEIKINLFLNKKDSILRRVKSKNNELALANDLFFDKHNEESGSLFYKNINLGLMQESYTRLDILITEWNNLGKDRIFEKKVESIQNEITYRERLQLISSRKMKLTENDYNLIKEELEASERLASENIISKQNLNQDKRSESQAFQAVQNQKEAYLQNMISLNELRKQIDLIKNENQVQKTKYISDIKLNIVTLKTALTDWEKSAFWIAPCDGKVLFNTQLQVNKFYKPDEASIVIVPDGNDMLGFAVIKSQGVGKVKKGQQTFIELENYPKNEFGLIEGTVSHITSIDNNGNYEIKIKLKNNLTTTYEKKIPYQVKLNGSIKIITKKKRLIERFFEKMLSLIK
jgi:multidrug resistance efflux pump